MAPFSLSASGSLRLIALAASRMQLNVPTRFTSSTFLKMSRSCADSYWPSRPMVRVAQPTPAAVTRARSGPSSLAASTAAMTWSTLATSAWAKMPPTSLATASPFSGFMSTMTHRAPRAASRRTVASPRPEAPPVTIAEMPLRSMASDSID